MGALQRIAQEAKTLCDLFDKQGYVSATDISALATVVVAWEKEIG